MRRFIVVVAAVAAISGVGVAAWLFVRDGEECELTRRRLSAIARNAQDQIGLAHQVAGLTQEERLRALVGLTARMRSLGGRIEAYETGPRDVVSAAHSAGQAAEATADGARLAIAALSGGQPVQSALARLNSGEMLWTRALNEVRAIRC